MAVYHHLRSTKLSQVLQSESCSVIIPSDFNLTHRQWGKLGYISAFTRN